MSLFNSSAWWWYPARNAPENVDIVKVFSQGSIQVMCVPKEVIIDVKSKLKRVQTNAVRPSFSKIPMDEVFEAGGYKRFLADKRNRRKKIEISTDVDEFEILID